MAGLPLRYVSFIRHGQYELVDGVFGGRLTALGRRQIRHAARRLGEWPIRAVYSSDLGRAVDSAAIIAARLDGLRVRETPLLRELHATAWPGVHVSLANRARGKEQLRAIVARFFRPTRRTRHDVVVAHGNLIRAVACQVQRAPLTNSALLATHNGGLTTFVVLPTGQTTLQTYNDTGHLRRDLVTVGASPVRGADRRSVGGWYGGRRATPTRT